MKLLVIGSVGRERALIWKPVIVLSLTFLLTATLTGRAAKTNSTDILGSLRPEHPRLLITGPDLVALRTTSTTNGEIDAIIAHADSAARALSSKPPLTYQKKGMRLLAVSEEAFRRIVLWSFAFRLTGQKEFLERAQQEMLNVASFKDWNPSHFLDTAEMTAAVAIGYDWLFDGLSASSRAAIRKAIVAKGLDPALDAQAGWNWWQRRENNWNQVCFGGLTLGALAVVEDEPARARELLERARTNNLHGMKSYSPDGIYPEGPGYWNFGTTYEVLMLSALESALGTDWNLFASPGFLSSAAALVQQTGPTGRPFNFSDCHDSVSFEPALFWFAQKLHQPGLVYFQNQELLRKLGMPQTDTEEDWFFPLLAIWAGRLPKEIPPPRLPLAWHGDGPNPVGVFRTSWTDINALFLALKGGSARVNHGHMDAGSFVLDADGVRWACDLGAQDYLSVESKGWSLWDSGQHSDRWRVYRLNNFSHNTLTLGGQLHNVDGDARITDFTTNSATVNLSKIFTGQARSVKRRFAIGEHRAVMIRDEITGGRPGLSVRWQMLTHADLHIEKAHAQLRQDGRILSARINSPPGKRFEADEANPPDDGVNQPNPNTRLLLINTSVPASGKLVIEVQLQPGT